MLHIPELPTFDGTLGQADAELLISFLTVPYLRMPLIVQFFASKNRLHALASEDVRRLLTGVLLEPSKCEPSSLRGKAPSHVPALDGEREMLGTPYGALLNECARSPHLVPVAMRDLLSQVIQLGTQPFRCKTTSLILCVIGLFVHVESAIRFLLQLAKGTHPSLSLDFIRGLEVSQEVRKQLESHLIASQALLQGEVRKVLLRWMRELEDEAQKAMRAKPESVDQITRDQCSVHAYIILTMRNVPLTGPTAWADITQLLTSFMFVERRHTWNDVGLLVPENQIWEIMHLRRREIVEWLNAQIKHAEGLTLQSERCKWNGAIQRLLHKVFVAGTGTEGYATEWSAYQEPANRGRFSAKITRLKKDTAGKVIEPLVQEEIGFITERDLPVEVNLQLLQVCTRGEHLQALEEDIAADNDIKDLFGKDGMPMQCAVLANNEHMRNRRLISHPLVVQAWDGDPDLPPMAPGRLYKPDELLEPEKWVGSVFEPCRDAHFVKLPKGPLEWYFPTKDESLPEGAQTAILIGFHPDHKKPWKEAIIFKAQRMVHVYMLRSHGRRYFRSLEYTSNATCTMHGLLPSPDDRKTAWPLWARHEAMDAEFKGSLEEYSPPPSDPSLVILRCRDRKTTAEVDHGATAAERAFDHARPDATPDGTLGASGHVAATRATPPEALPTWTQDEGANEWAPIEGSWSRPRPTEEEDQEEAQDADDAGSQASLRDPPPADVIAMLRSRQATLKGTLELLERVAALGATQQRQTSGKQVAALGAAAGADTVAPTLYQITSVAEYDDGIESWEAQGPLTVGLKELVTHGCVMFEVVICSVSVADEAGDFCAGWVTSTFGRDGTAKEETAAGGALTADAPMDRAHLEQMYAALSEPRPHGCEGDFDWFVGRLNELRQLHVDDLTTRASDENVTIKCSAAGDMPVIDASTHVMKLAFLLCGGDLQKLDACQWGDKEPSTAAHAKAPTSDEKSVGTKEQKRDDESGNESGLERSMGHVNKGTPAPAPASGMMVTGTMSGIFMSGKTIPNVSGLLHPREPETYIFAVHEDGHTKMAAFKIPGPTATPVFMDGRAHEGRLVSIDAGAIGDTWDSAQKRNVRHEEYEITGIVCRPSPDWLLVLNAASIRKEPFQGVPLREDQAEWSKWADGDVLSIAADVDTGALYFAKNGAWVTVWPKDQVRAAAMQQGVHAALIVPKNTKFGINFGEAPWAYPPPSEDVPAIAIARAVSPGAAADAKRRCTVLAGDVSTLTPSKPHNLTNHVVVAAAGVTPERLPYEGGDLLLVSVQTGTPLVLCHAERSKSGEEQLDVTFQPVSGKDDVLTKPLHKEEHSSRDGSSDGKRREWWEELHLEPPSERYTMYVQRPGQSPKKGLPFLGRVETAAPSNVDDDDEFAFEEVVDDEDKMSRQRKYAAVGSMKTLNARTRSQKPVKRGDAVGMAIDSSDGVSLHLTRHHGHRRERWVLTPLSSTSDVAKKLARYAKELTSSLRKSAHLLSALARAEFFLERAEKEADTYEQRVRFRRKKQEDEHQEQLLPSRLLYGLLPTVLLDAHDMYQDVNEPRLLRGYPKPEAIKEQNLDKAVLREQQQKNRDFRLMPQKREAYRHTLKVTLFTLPHEHAVCATFAGSRTFGRIERKYPERKRQEHHVLMSLCHAVEGSQLLSLARTLSRVEALSHILCWGRMWRAEGAPAVVADEFTWASGIDAPFELVPEIIELPRLKLTLRVERELPSGEYRLYSTDHDRQFVPDLSSSGVERGGSGLDRQVAGPARALAASIPHALLLCSANEEYTIVVPNVMMVRPVVQDQPFSTDLVLVREGEEGAKWHATAQTKYFSYPIHVSNAFLQPPSLASALYLLVLRIQARDYAGASTLIGSISTDGAMTKEEEQIFNLLGVLKDGHPDLHAVRIKIMLAEADAQIRLPWDMRKEQAAYITKLSHVQARCRLADKEERTALLLCQEELKKLKLVSDKTKELLDDKEKKNRVQRIITDQLSGTHEFDDRKEMMDYLKDVRVAFAHTNLRATDEDILHYFLDLERRQGRAELPEVLEDVLWNREQLLERVRDEEKAQRATDKSTWAAGVHEATCTVRSVKPPKDGFAHWITWRLDGAPNGDYTKQSGSGGQIRHHPWRSAMVGKELAIALAHQVMERETGLTGDDYLTISFLYVYELLTGTSEVNFSGNKEAAARCNHTFATLLLILFKDAGEKSILSSVLNTLARNPWVCSTMPKWADTRSYRSWTIKYSGWDTSNPAFSHEDPLSRLLYKAQETLVKLANFKSNGAKLGFLLAESLPPRGFRPPVMITRGLNLLLHPPLFPEPYRPLATGDKMPDGTLPEPAEETTLKLHRIVCKADDGETQLTMLWTGALKGAVEPNLGGGITRHAHKPCTEQTDYARDSLIISHSVELEGVTNDAAAADTLRQLLCTPLLVEPTAGGALEPSRAPRVDETQNNPFDGNFDIKLHPEARSRNSIDYIQRIGEDFARFVGRDSRTSTLAGLNGSLDRVHKRLSTADAELSRILVAVQLIQAKLSQLAAEDRQYVARAQTVLLQTANSVDTKATGTSYAPADAYRFLLLRHSRHESLLWLQYLVGCLLSRLHFDDLQKLNPFLSEATMREIENLLATMLLRANRVVHANRALDAAADVVTLIVKVRDQLAKRSTPVSKATAVELQLKADRLVTMLRTGREYTELDIEVRKEVRKEKWDEARAKEYKEQTVATRSASGRTIDPRFLAFEFIWSLQLRARQVDLVLDCVRAASAPDERQRSIVKQMIMGAGKTSVVSPLISLMLAQGEYLVVQCMPAALLPMSFNILRTTFSSAIQKRVYTFACERSTAGTSALEAKMVSAKERSAVVVTTPQAIKSLHLNFIESLTIATDSSNARYRNPELRPSVEVWASLLKLMRAGCCIMDEVDLVLHPLKSELNFPIGKKERLDFTDGGQRWQVPAVLFDALLFAKDVASRTKYATRADMPKRLTGSLGDDECENKLFPLMEAIAATLRLGFETTALQQTPHMILLREDFYIESRDEPEVREVVKQYNVQKLSMQKLMALWLLPLLRRSEVDKKGFSDDDVVGFVTRAPAALANPELRQRFKDLREHARAMLNLSADWVTQFLPHALKKIDRVTFGVMNEEDLAHARRNDPLMPRSRAKLAIPFISKDVPAPASEFAQPDVVIGLTTLAYRIEGLREEDFGEAIEKLMQDFESETGRYDERPSAELYAEWVQLCGGEVAKPDTNKAARDSTDANKAARDSTAAGADAEPPTPVVAAPPPDHDSKKLAPTEPRKLVVMPLQFLDRSDRLQTEPLFSAFRLLPEFIHWYLSEICFPFFMKFQDVKLSSSGVDMGGAMLFSRRIGFSGTPSDLLPREFNGGKCEFEPGSEGEIVSTLTSANIMGASLLPKDWTADSVLDWIADEEKHHKGVSYNALIDVGALITGKTNLEVAAALVSQPHYLGGVEKTKGVVFLDKSDQKMIYLRGVGTVLRLEESSLKPSERFCFYDQMHTTGMDIGHALTAKAILTLGKDSTWRDYAQGAYRMRGIAKGQTCSLLLTPEVWQLVCRDMLKIQRAKEVAFEARDEEARDEEARVKEADSQEPQHQSKSTEASTDEIHAIKKHTDGKTLVVFHTEPSSHCDSLIHLLEHLVPGATHYVLVGSQRLKRHVGPHLIHSAPCDHPVFLEFTRLQNGSATFPALYIDGEYAGSCRETYESFINGSLHPKFERLPSLKGLLRKPSKSLLETSELHSNAPVATAAWLQLQQLRSEKIQFQMLQLQNLSDVWRCPAFVELLHAHQQNTIEDVPPPSKDFYNGLMAFRERVDLVVPREWLEPKPVAKVFSERIKPHSTWVKKADPKYWQHEEELVEQLKELTESERNADEPRLRQAIIGELSSESIIGKLYRNMRGLASGDSAVQQGALEQCMECEQQKEQQKELEQQTEMEKFVDVKYARDGEEGRAWPFEQLRELGALSQDSGDAPESYRFFYPASKFRLFGRKPLLLADRLGDDGKVRHEDLLLTTNYFDPRWSGERRLRNVTIMLEWMPNRRQPMPHGRDLDADQLPAADDEAGKATTTKLSASLEDAMNKVFDLLKFPRSGRLPMRAIQLLLRETFDRPFDDQEVRTAVRAVTSLADDSTPNLTLDFEGAKKLLLSKEFRCYDNGRRFVLLSLAEAETVRRVMHAREEQNLIDGAATAIALRSMPMGGTILESSLEFEAGPAFQRELVIQLARFLDGEMYFEPSELSSLVKALQLNTLGERQHFFTRLCGCRRRYATQWAERPVVAVLRGLPTEFDLLTQRIEARAMRLSIMSQWNNIEDAFSYFDNSPDGELDEEEVLDMLIRLGLPCKPVDVLRFITSADKDGSLTISIKEFRQYLNGVRQASEAYDADDPCNALFAHHATPREPSDEERAQLLEEVRQAMTSHRRHVEAEQAQLPLNYKRMVEEMEANCETGADLNPIFIKEDVRWRWDFTRRRLPRLITYAPSEHAPVPQKTGGARQSDAFENGYLFKLPEPTYLKVDTEELHTEQQLPQAFSDAWTKCKFVNAYALTLAVQFPFKPPRARQPYELVTLRRAVGDQEQPVGSLVLYHDGQLGLSVSPNAVDPVVHIDGANSAPAGAPVYWPHDHMRTCRAATLKGTQLKTEGMAADAWQIVTLSVQLRTESPMLSPHVRVYLNGEMMLELTAAAVADASGETAISLTSALAPDGPFSLDTTAGLRLFGDYHGARGHEDKPLLKKIRTLILSPSPASSCRIWVEHTALGVWRCHHCDDKYEVPCVETGPQKGFRNGPDAKFCAFCSQPRPDSQLIVNPSGRDNTTNPGLWTFTAANFDKEVIDADADCLVVFSADWCPASKKAKPHVLDLAKLLAECDDVRVGLFDTELNQADRKYYWEGSIPCFKFFVRGKKQRPMCYEGERKVNAFMRYIAKEGSKPTNEKGAEDLLEAQWLAYARKHGLFRRLHLLLSRFKRARTNEEEAELTAAPSADDDAKWKAWSECNLKGALERAHSGNWERWVATLFADPEPFSDTGSDGELASLTDGAMRQLAPVAAAQDQLGRDWDSEVVKLQEEDSTRLLERIFTHCRYALVGSWPDNPLETLSLYFMRQVGVRIGQPQIQESSPRPQNLDLRVSVPPRWRTLLKDEKIMIWERAVHAEEIARGSAEEKRVWPAVTDAMVKPLRFPHGPQRNDQLVLTAEVLAQLIRRGLSLDTQPQGLTMCHLCASYGDDYLPLLNQLYWSGANIAAASTSARSHGMLPIELAATMGYVAAVRRLHAMGSPIGRALFCAIEESQIEVVNLLLKELKVPIDARWAGHFHVTPLEWAVILGSTDVAEVLIKYHAQRGRILAPSTCTRYDLAPGSSLAHLCAKLGGARRRMLGMLVGNLDPINGRIVLDESLIIKDQWNRTMHDVADARILKQLDARRYECWSVLDKTLLSGSFDRSKEKMEEMRQELVEAVRKGGDPACQNDIGWTCMMVVALASEPVAAEALLQERTLVAGKDSDPVEEQRRQAEAARVLYATSASGLTALMWSSWVAWLTGPEAARLAMPRGAVSAATSTGGDGGNGSAAERFGCGSLFSHVDEAGEYAYFQRSSGSVGGDAASNLEPVKICEMSEGDQRHVRAMQLVDLFARRGATLRHKDKMALERLKCAYRAADAEDRELLTFDPRHLRRSVSDGGGGALDEEGCSEALHARLTHGGGLRSHMVVPKHYPDDYAEHAEPLEEFLKKLGDKNEDAFSHKGELRADEFDGKMSRLLAFAKLFVQDKVATGCTVAPKHIFALHLYTMQSSIYEDTNAAMRGGDAKKIKVWMPFIFHLDRALAALNARSTIVFRGIHLPRDSSGDGTVRKFLDGNTHLRGCKDAMAQDEIDVTYHEGKRVLWPAFSSMTTDPAIALAYATKNLDTMEAAVIFKIHTRKAYPIREFSYYPFEEELVYPGSTCFRIKALLEPTASNLRSGTFAQRSVFSCDTAHIVSSSLELNDAQKRKRLLIELQEELLPEDHQFMNSFDEVQWEQEKQAKKIEKHRSLLATGDDPWNDDAPSFYFVPAKWVRECSTKSLPLMQTLRKDGHLTKRSVPLASAFLRADGIMANILFVSHRWENNETPDLGGDQLKAIKEYLQENPAIEWVWFDYSSMPQGRDRTTIEKAEFDLMLGSITDFYLTARVLILLDGSYASRFWTLTEAWCSMQTVTADGLRPATEAERRYTIKCIHNATTETTAKGLVDLVSTKNPEEMHQVLKKPDVNVTNMKDKEAILPKILKINQHVKETFRKLKPAAKTILEASL